MATSRPTSPGHQQHPPALQDQGHGLGPKTDDKSAVSDARRTTSDAEKEDLSIPVQWVSGLKLWILMMPLCFTFFLVLLDISIIATVGLLDRGS
jgi:hypothetical protein